MTKTEALKPVRALRTDALHERAEGDVAVSTRIRLARNFKDYPFPNRLTDPALAQEIVHLVSEELRDVESFRLYRMSNVGEETAQFLRERNLISQDLLKNRAISAVLVLEDESVSVMINEEDHIRIPFAYDRQLGYLTACPTNLGTGLRASVMLFLPAAARAGLMRGIAEELSRDGLTVRGAYGEGSGAEGALYQISNERTLGPSEGEILGAVESAVCRLIRIEREERARLLREDRAGIADVVLRSLGILTNCVRLTMREFMRYMANVKLGVALGLLSGSLEELDGLIMNVRPANIDQLNGGPPEEGGYDIFRAAYVGDVLRRMELITEEGRARLLDPPQG